MGSNIVRFDAVRSIANGSITSSYQPLGAAFGHAMRVMYISNPTDGDMMFSFDSITDNFFVPAGGYVVFDLTSDQDANESFRYQAGSQLYIKYITAPTKETVYVTLIYGKGE
jgi:hypothetical protein